MRIAQKRFHALRIRFHLFLPQKFWISARPPAVSADESRQFALGRSGQYSPGELNSIRGMLSLLLSLACVELLVTLRVFSLPDSRRPS